MTPQRGAAASSLAPSLERDDRGLLCGTYSQLSAAHPNINPSEQPITPTRRWCVARLTAVTALLGGSIYAVADRDGVAGGGLDRVFRLLERFA